MARPLKILMISQMAPYLPCNDGFRIIPANVIKRLAGRHEVHLMAFTDGHDSSEQLDWAKPFCASVMHVATPPPVSGWSRLRRMQEPYPLPDAALDRIKKLRPDVLHLEGPYMASLARHAPAGCGTVLSAHDCMALRYEHFARFAESLRQKLRFRVLGTLGARYERRWYPQVDRVVVTSALDADRLTRMAPAVHVLVIPNGVEIAAPAAVHRVARRMIFTGNMSWFPNEDAAEFFVQQILPRIRREYPDAEFWIVGSSPSPRVQELGKTPGVVVTGTVPVLSEYIRAAEVYVSPLRFGAGVKNKILEAMAADVPIVATPISLSGTPLFSGRHLLVAEKPAEIAEAVTKIFQQPDLAASLTQESLRELQARYTWDRIADQFDAIYSSLAG